MKMKRFAVHANAPHPDSDSVGPDLANIRYTWIPHVPDGGQIWTNIMLLSLLQI